MDIHPQRLASSIGAAENGVNLTAWKSVQGERKSPPKVSINKEAVQPEKTTPTHA